MPFREPWDMLVAASWLIGSLWLASRLVEAAPRVPGWLVFTGTILTTGLLATLII